MLKKRIEYLIAISSSLILLEIGFFYALVWYWSGFEWSPLGYETCGMEFIAILIGAILCKLLSITRLQLNYSLLLVSRQCPVFCAHFFLIDYRNCATFL